MSDENKNTGGTEESKKTGGTEESKKTEFNQDSFNKGFEKADARSKTKIEELQKKVDEYEVLQAEINKKKEDEEQNKLKDKAEFDKALVNVKKTHSEEKATLENEKSQLTEQLRSRIIKTELYKIVSEVDIIPSAIGDVVELSYNIMDYTVENIDGKQIDKVFPSHNGTPMMDEKTGEPLTVKGYFEQLLERKPHYKKSLSSGGSGSQTNSGIGGKPILNSTDAIRKGRKDRMINR